MKKIKAEMLVILFISAFTVGALVTASLTGSAPNSFLRVAWNFRQKYCKERLFVVFWKKTEACIQ